MTDRVAVNIDKGIAHVTLTRGDKMNALDVAMFDALIAAGEQLKTDASVRVVVLSGQGRAFCAGLDMSSFTSSEDATDLEQRTHGITNRFQQVAWVWRELPVPVIAAVHGTAFGGGLQIMLGADIRYLHPATKCSIMEIKWGLVPDMAGTQLWGNLVREDLLRELTYTGRVFTGQQALDYGFATQLSGDPKAMAQATARDIAGKNPDAIRANKRLFNAQSELDHAAGMMRESIEQEALIGSANQREAVMATLENRAADFE